MNVFGPLYEIVRRALPLEAVEKLTPFWRTLFGATGLVIDHDTFEVHVLAPEEMRQFGAFNVPLIPLTITGVHAPQLLFSPNGGNSVIVPTNAVLLSAHARTNHGVALGNVYRTEARAVPEEDGRKEVVLRDGIRRFDRTDGKAGSCRLFLHLQKKLTGPGRV